MKERHIREIKSVFLLTFGVILLASIISYTPADLPFYTSHPNIPAKNFVRVFGACLSGIIFFLMGWTAYALPVVIFYWSARIFRNIPLNLRLVKFIGFAVFILSCSSLLSMFGIQASSAKFARGGLLGAVLSVFVERYFGNFGAVAIFFALGLLSFTLITDYFIASQIFSTASAALTSLPLFWNQKGWKIPGFPDLGGSGDSVNKRASAVKVILPGRDEKKQLKDKEQTRIAEEDMKSVNAQQSLAEPAVKPRIEIKVNKTQDPVKAKIPEIKMGDYKLPNLDLLNSPPPVAERQLKEDLTSNARILEEALLDFGLIVKVTDIERGPVITRYELEPAPGVKIQKITSLSDDIALALKAPSVRIVAPIPGKARVGIEIPNIKSSMVYLKEVLASNEFEAAGSKITLALGKDISGKTVIADLADMPHLLIAGTTGSGKTVCVNSLILSILYKSTPREVKLVMIDPKMVELAIYNGLPHLLCPVITDAKKAANALAWVVSEMEERYKTLATAGARNISAYNAKSEILMPYIVVVIDELADLMMVAQDEIESGITRLAQLSRAVGIHLLLATQRPSVDVITGVIKANFPARISFQVASKVDSRTVLDANGADKLLGRGDMLFLKPGEAKLIRAQASFVKDGEIDNVVNFIKGQSKPVYEEAILKEQERTFFSSGQKDELYDDAVKVVMETGQASVSILQRRMRLGYTRAARLIDMMELDGLVGPYQGSKPRDIMVERQQWLKDNLNKQQGSASGSQTGPEKGF